MKIGIDVGGTNIAGGLVRNDGTLVFKTSVPTVTKNGEDGLLRDICALCETCRREAGSHTVSGIGIGVPGHADDTMGIVVRCANIPFKNTALSRYVTEKTGLSCHIGNDADAAALAEVRFGSAREFENAVMLTLGTGIGGGIIINNRIFRGCNGAAGELGHMTIYADGEKCSCGRRGCFELYASATALKRETLKALDAHPESKLRQVAKTRERVNAKTAFDAAAAGDAVAIQLIRQYTEHLACGILNIINILCPDAIILGGGVARQGESLLAPLREIVRDKVYSTYGTQTKLLAATLGNDAGIIGAAFFGE